MLEMRGTRRCETPNRSRYTLSRALHRIKNRRNLRVQFYARQDLPSFGYEDGSINQCIYIVALNDPRLTRRMIIWNKVSRNKSLPRQESFN